jgi:hypothetical protein
MVQAGALAYAANGCTNCHGQPGVEPAKFSEGLNPPPDLRKVSLIVCQKSFSGLSRTA